MRLKAFTFITDVYVTRMSTIRTSWHSWLKKTFLKVLSCSQLLPTSEPSNERPDVGQGTEWGRTWVSTSVDSLSILDLFIDLLYCKESKLRAWEAAIHVLLITGHCEGEPELSGSSHFRQSVYPHVVYSVHQLATTEVMFTTRCSLVPRLSPHGNQATISWTGAWEWGYKVYTRRIL